MKNDNLNKLISVSRLTAKYIGADQVKVTDDIGGVVAIFEKDGYKYHMRIYSGTFYISVLENGTIIARIHSSNILRLYELMEKGIEDGWRQTNGYN